MNKKVVAVLVIVIIVVLTPLIVYIYLQSQPPQIQPLKFDCTIILTGYRATVYLNTYTDGTLFRCNNTIEYLASDGDWKNISAQIGTMDAGTRMNGRTYYLNNFQPSDDMNFSYFAEGMTRLQFNETAHFRNLKIDAYGYTAP